MHMIQGKDIVIVGLQPWDTEIGSNCKDVALEMSKNNRVLYVNSPLDRITKFRHKDKPFVKNRLAKMQQKENSPALISSNLWVFDPNVIIESVNWIKVDFIFDLLNKWNNQRFAHSIKKAISVLEMENFILFNDSDIFRSFYLKELLNPELSIYYSRDYLLSVDYWKYHGVRLEPKLMAKSDICVANSTYLTDLCKRYNPNSYYVGQGCETDAFLEAGELAVPNQITTIAQPIIGYVGALTTIRLDLEIITYIATENPQWNIVLVGPEDDEFKASQLHELKNVYFTGSKDPKELPAYVGSFTVCINPQLVNELTIGNYPRKIDEYLAAGKPVVATKTEGMSEFAAHCYLATNKHEYVKYIREAMVSDSAEASQERKTFASSHTWENSVGKIYEAITVSAVTV
ncbi:glycosyltransferase [Pedobacter immunditicola]|uniref:glycosyltransferase n=1 Tax=Pedobacter immunditicola TaxID=3133440 RepID=UPI0030A322AB